MENKSNAQELEDKMMARASLIIDKDDAYLKDLDPSSDQVIGQSFYRLAKVYYDKADLANAESFFLKALKRSEFPKDLFGMFKIYGFLIRIYSEAGRDQDAEEMIQHSSELMEKASKELGTLNAEYFYNVGVIKTYSGDFFSANESFLISCTKAEQDGDTQILPKSYFALAKGYYKQEKYEQALKYLDKLKNYILNHNKDYLKGTMHILYAQIFTEQGEYKNALNHYEIALQSFRSKSCWNLYSVILIGKGVVHRKLGEFQKALLFFDLAKNSLDDKWFRKQTEWLDQEIEETNSSSVDLYLDRHNRVIYEKELGQIDFKHRFVLLEILFLLARNPGSCFDKEQLARSIWKDEYNPLIHDKLIYTSISRLRKLIEPKSAKRKYILRRKDGYSFNPRIEARFHGENENRPKGRIGNVEISSPV